MEGEWESMGEGGVEAIVVTGRKCEEKRSKEESKSEVKYFDA